MPKSLQHTNKAKRLMKVHNREEKMTRLDRIKSYYFQQTQLDKEDDGYRKLLELANAMQVGGKTKSQIAKVLMKALGNDKTSKSTAYKIIREAPEIFGDVFKANKSGLRHILTEQYLLLSSLAQKAGELELSRRCLDSIGAIHNLKEPDVSQSSLPRRRIAIKYTTDPKALTENVIVIDE